MRAAALIALAKVGESQLSVPALLSASADANELVQKTAQHELQRFIGEGLPARVVASSRVRVAKSAPSDEHLPEIF